MRRIVIAICLVFALSLPAFALPWTLIEQSVPYDPLLAESIQRWHDNHLWEIDTLLTTEQQQIFKELVLGTLTWAYTRGNSFNADEFLDSFKDRDDSVYVIRYADGGIGLVLRGVYLRIVLDRTKPDFLSNKEDNEWPQAGRWFAEIGCGSNSQTFYFLAATADKSHECAVCSALRAKQP